VAAVSNGDLAAVAAAAAALGAALLVLWLWRRGGPHKGDPPE
jgi:hypothetical protein